MDITIFYSWISDYENSNKSFIRACINSAIKRLEKDSLPELNGISIKMTESLGNAPGHQLLSTTQEDEIRNSDIFVGDWTVTDPYNMLERFMARHFGYSRKRNINSNVIHEYDCFSETNGYDGAILVMDSTRGSAKEDNDIIPIDLRGRRFPIEYLGKDSKDSLILDLYRALKISVPAAIKQRKNRFSPLHTWYEQNEKASLNTPYYENEKLSSLRQYIKDSKDDLRILGLSGIGKTRIVHEAFKNDDDSLYRNNYLYVQYSQDEDVIIKNAISTHIQNSTDNSLLIVDNCPPSFARHIQQLKTEYRASNRIITLHNRQDQDSTDKVQDVDYITILLDDVSSVVDDILNGIFSKISDDKKKIIKDFSAGLPMMAVILAKNVEDGRLDFATIPNNELVEKLLDTNDCEEKEILMSCSMFSHIGYRDECAGEAKFIICNTNITPMLSGDDIAKMTLFQRAFNKYSVREIFETQGRFFAIRPIPLALKLAEDWLSGCSAERLLCVIKDIQDEDQKNSSQMLTSAFANQMAHLAGNPKAQKIVSIITGENSPFADAEVLNTELGSRLFRSFVEVDPESVAVLLWKVFGDSDKAELLKIRSGRRNLVWTIQKLCFDKRTFLTGAKLLIKFGVAENETWGNNATNEALNLFHIYLPGTEADLNQRLEIIKWVGKLDNAGDLYIKIISSAFTCQHYSYFGGAETQGTRTLEHYVPSGKEIITYWENVASLLKEYIDANPSEIDAVSNVVSNNFSGLIRAGVLDIAFDLSEYIAEIRGWEWDELREDIRLMFWRSNSKEYPESLTYRLKTLQQKLTKNDLISRLKDVEHYESERWEDELKKREEQYRNLAREFVSSEHSSVKLLEDILSDSSIKPYPSFGQEIYNSIKGDECTYHKIADTIIRISGEKKEYFDNTLLGFFSHSTDEDFEYARTKLYEVLPEALFPLYAMRHISIDKCGVLFDMTTSGVADVKAFDKFCVYYDWSTTSQEDIIRFYDKLARTSSEGANIAMDRINSMLYFDANKGEHSFIINKYKELILSEVFPVQLDNETYMEHIDTIIGKYNNPDVASFISKRLITHYFSESTIINHYGHYADNVLSVLFDKYFETVWPDWAIALANPDNIPFSYMLKFKLGRSVGGLVGGALFGANHDVELKQWCFDYPESAPVLLAMYVPVYSGDSLSPLAIFLLDNYGDNKRVLNELSCNLGSFSCVGSAVPIYEHKKIALQKLLPHKNPSVNEWLLDNIRFAEKDISKEMDRDAEDTIIYR